MVRQVKAVLGPIVTAWRVSKRRRQVRRCAVDFPRIVLGAGDSSYDGWISTNIDTLNIVKREDWKRCFGLESLHSLLAEHVWEHLTKEEAVAAAANCFDYLKPGGRLRVAVPDGYNPSKDYMRWVTEGGPGSGSDDHKVLYNYETLSEVFRAARFQVRLLEYHDENGVFHFEEWNPDDGFIGRSSRYDSVVNSSRRGLSEPYTSIIVDAIKPGCA